MAIGNIFKIPQKTTINHSLQSKSIMVVGKSKSGKSTIASQAPRAVFLMTENGGEGLTGFTPVPIASWSDFKNAVTQLCSAEGRKNFDTVVIDTYTNLILLLDKFIGSKLSTDKTTFDFGSDAEYGKGTKGMRAELGFQLQRLANQGYLLLNIVHAEDKTNFDTGKDYIGTSLSNSLYGVAEKFVDQIIYLRKERPTKEGNVEHRIYFNDRGGFAGAGGRFTPDVDYVPCSFENLEKALLNAMAKVGATTGAALTKNDGPSVVIEQVEHDFDELVAEFKTLTDKLVAVHPETAPKKITAIVERELGVGKKVSGLTAAHAELLYDVLETLKREFDFELN